MGDFGKAVNLGYNIGVGAEFTQPTSPVGFRLEIDFHENSYEDQLGDGSFRTLAGIANLIYAQNKTEGPYLIGGVGLYRGYDPDIDDSGETKAGINGGIGYRFGLSGFSTFVEARYHHIFTDANATQMIPISFGVRF